MERNIQNVLISVFHKEGLEPIVQKLKELGVRIYSTGGTEKFIKECGVDVIPIEDLTAYPSILGGRVKTLHPKVFGGILNRQNVNSDQEECSKYDIPQLDLVIVDLYPFEKTVASGQSHSDIIEKIDIGGISLIRAAAKNYKDVLCISSQDQYAGLLEILSNKEAKTNLEERQRFAAASFQLSSHYDTAIFNYFTGHNEDSDPVLKLSEQQHMPLRYGENPHQKGTFFGDFNGLFDQLHGKALSYNNLLDIDAAVQLMREFKDDSPTFAILKHNNACGLATRDNLHQAYVDALAGDPISAFGGILIANTTIDLKTAEEISSLFCEVVIAPEFDAEAQVKLQEKKNRILLVQKNWNLPKIQVRTALNGYLWQEQDSLTETQDQLKTVTTISPSQNEIDDLLFAAKICKHTKSNTIVLAKNRQLIASGTGQTSRVDALKQAIQKAKAFKFELEGAVMASDAFFPFPDCVEIAHNEKISSVIQPGGSIKDELSIDFCNNAKMSMLMTGIRHFKH